MLPHVLAVALPFERGAGWVLLCALPTCSAPPMLPLRGSWWPQRPVRICVRRGATPGRWIDARSGRRCGAADAPISIRGCLVAPWAGWIHLDLAFGGPRVLLAVDGAAAGFGGGLALALFFCQVVFLPDADLSDLAADEFWSSPSEIYTDWRMSPQDI